MRPTGAHREGADHDRVRPPRPRGPGIRRVLRGERTCATALGRIPYAVRALLPAVAAPIVGVKGEDPILGPYTTTAAALAALKPHARHLQHDGFLEFGLIYQVSGVTEEVFVRSVKYVQVWTNQPDRAAESFARLGLPEMPDLQFIDQFPRVSESLQTADGNAEWPDVVEQLRAAFDELPPAEDSPADV